MLLPREPRRVVCTPCLVGGGRTQFLFQFVSFFLLPLIFSLSSLHSRFFLQGKRQDFHQALCNIAFYARTAHLTRSLCLKGGTSCLPRCLRSELFLLSAHGRLHWDRLSNKLVIDDLHAHYTMKAHVKARLSTNTTVTLLVVYDVVNESEADYYKIISLDANARSLVQNMIQCQCNVRCRKCVRRSNPLSCRAILGKGILVDVLFKHVVQRQFRCRRFN